MEVEFLVVPPQTATIPFQLSSEALQQGSYIVRVTGEVDLHTAPRLARELDELIDAGATHLAVDLTEVPFLDSSALGVLLAAGRRVGRDALALQGVGLEARRVLGITGADRVLTLTDGEPSRPRAERP